ncbi:MAG: bifunctional riboflavin kinase/FAD synthetase [Planctomycetota bacterium]|nr:MAG: bifunctional riboflavin kinase/FAD synthetase [Planctomycetota bacterium]
MKLLRQVTDLPAELRRGAVAIGNFDGVHLGHARIVDRVIEKARDAGGAALVFTFDPHPVRLLRPQQAPPPLTWTQRKAQLLAELGIDAVIAFPTDEELLALEASEFFERIVRRQLDARAIVEGPNFCFGRGRKGTIDVLRSLAEADGISLDVVEPVVVDGDYVSSSRIRKLVADGQVAAARAMLTQPYRIRGMVVHGAGRGAKLGFGTANLDAIDTLLPSPGVYAGRGIVGDRRYPAAINIGPNPTFGEGALKVEAHLVGWDGSPLYGEPLEVDFLDRLRNIQRFAGPDALVAQLQDDIQRTRQAFQQFELADKLAGGPGGG